MMVGYEVLEVDCGIDVVEIVWCGEVDFDGFVFDLCMFGMLG